MRMDIAMWAKNGAKFLPLVLKRIDEAIPSENIGNKIFVDDRSTDESAKIARDFNWSVYENKEGGIGNGANLALSKVETEIFASFEQDVLLTKNWYERIYPLINEPKTAVAQGWRYSTNRTLYDLETGVPWVNVPRYSLDNNLYKTKIIRSIGGFPAFVNYCIDGVLRSLIIKNNWKWITDSSTISTHLKPMGLMSYAMSAERRGRDFAVASNFFLEDERRKMSMPYLIFNLAASPVVAMGISLYKKNPFIIPYFPFEKLYKLKGYLKVKCNYL